MLNIDSAFRSNVTRVIVNGSYEILRNKHRQAKIRDVVTVG